MLSQSSKYAIKILIYLASTASIKFHSVPDITDQVDIPGPYLSKIIKQLARAKFVETRKGPGGGVRIVERGLNASFFDIGELFKESIVRESCFLSRNACNSDSPCPLHSAWLKTRSQVVSFLKKQLIHEAAKRSR